MGKELKQGSKTNKYPLQVDIILILPRRKQRRSEQLSDLGDSVHLMNDRTRI